MDSKRQRLNSQPGSRRQRLQWLLASLVLCTVWILGANPQALAQAEEVNWSTPENLSHSGAASSPVVVVAPNGTLRVIWWDEFDGLMVADGAGGLQGDGTWLPPKMATLSVTRPAEVPGETITRPIDRAPRIVGDTNGQAHAFWLDEPDRDTGERELLYSRLSPGRTTWTSPRPLVGSASSFDAAVDESGTLHLVYVRPKQAGGLSSGLYYERSRDAGSSWISPRLISDSLYLRLLSDEESPLRLTADSQESIFVTWADPRTRQVLVAHTPDGGTTWQEPRPYTASDGSPLLTRAIAVPDRPDMLLWKPVDEEASMVAVSGGDNTLTLAYWIDDRWAATRQLTLRFKDPNVGEPLSLSILKLALVPPLAGQGDTVNTLALAGLDQKGDVWVAGIPTDEIERLATLPADTSAIGPANLSQGGSSSSPAVVAGPNDTLHAIWWDQYQGLMVADGIVSASTSVSGTEEIVTSQEVWEPARPVPLPVRTTPRLLAGEAGMLHAFWLQEPGTALTETESPGARAVMYSQLEANGSAWSPPLVLAEAALGFDIVADASGALHLAYIQGLEMPHASAGVYYRRSEPDGTTWRAPAAIHLSRYLRSLGSEATHLDLAVDPAGGVYVTWDDARQERAQLAFSPDSGQTWTPPVPVGDPQRQALRGRLVAVADGQTFILWEAGHEGSTCSLYQGPAEQILHGPDRGGQRVLDDLITCPQNERILPLPGGQSLMVAGSGSESLTIVVWDGQHWSKPRQLGFDFKDPDSEGNVYLDDLGFALVALPAGPGGELGSKALMVVGIDGGDDVWATSSQMGILETVFAPPPPWSQPTSFSASQEIPILPAVATDNAGQIHVLWSESASPEEPGTGLLYARGDGSTGPGPGEESWTLPARVLQSPTGGVAAPALIAVGDRLHAVWSGGENGEIFYSWAFGRDAYTSGGWDEPLQLPAPVDMGSSPVIAPSAGGTLHVIFAVPVNEQRGIYYTRSSDAGETWSAAYQVFDAAAAEWVMVDYPRLVVDKQGVLHAIWVRYALPGTRTPEGIYHARSADGGATWSQPVEIRDGPSHWPQVAVSGDGRLLVVWAEGSQPPTWWHQWSEDGGQSWTLPEPVPGFAGVAPPASLFSDGEAALYLTGLGHDDTGSPALLFSTWDGQRWETDQPFRLDVESADVGVSVARSTTLQRLDAVFRGEAESGEGSPSMQLWHSWRQAPLSVATPPEVSQPETEPLTPEAVLTPHSTSAVASTSVAAALSTPGPSPTPRYDAALASGPANSSSVPTPLIIAGGLAALIVAGGFAMGLLRSRRR